MVASQTTAEAEDGPWKETDGGMLRGVRTPHIEQDAICSCIEGAEQERNRVRGILGEDARPGAFTGPWEVPWYGIQYVLSSVHVPTGPSNNSKDENNSINSPINPLALFAARIPPC